MTKESWISIFKPDLIPMFLILIAFITISLVLYLF